MKETTEMSGKKLMYAAWNLLVVSAYSGLLWFGVTFGGRQERHYVPGGLRGAAHTGYRSFWYSGFHGGK